MSMLGFEAVGLVGLVVAVHAGPFQLNIKPFSCGFCFSFWLGVVYFLQYYDVRSAVIGIGITTLVAGIVAVFTPLFRAGSSGSFEDEFTLDGEATSETPSLFHVVRRKPSIPLYVGEYSQTETSMGQSPVDPQDALTEKICIPGKPRQTPEV